MGGSPVASGEVCVNQSRPPTGRKSIRQLMDVSRTSPTRNPGEAQGTYDVLRVLPFTEKAGRSTASMAGWDVVGVQALRHLRHRGRTDAPDLTRRCLYGAVAMRTSANTCLTRGVLGHASGYWRDVGQGVLLWTMGNTVIYSWQVSRQGILAAPLR